MEIDGDGACGGGHFDLGFQSAREEAARVGEKRQGWWIHPIYRQAKVNLGSRARRGVAADPTRARAYLQEGDATLARAAGKQGPAVSDRVRERARTQLRER